jgi:hypothetical protein
MGAPTADDAKVVTGKVWQRPRDRFEIIDNTDPGQSEAGAQLGRIDNPRIIRERATSTCHHACHREDRVPDRRALRLTGQECRKRVAEVLIIAHRHVLDRAQPAARQQRETHIGAADIRQHDVPDAVMFGLIGHGRAARAALIRSAYQWNDAFGMRRCVA